jgi:hypothetical protein
MDVIKLKKEAENSPQDSAPTHVSSQSCTGEREYQIDDQPDSRNA